jgi:hypothetical protein
MEVAGRDEDEEPEAAADPRTVHQPESLVSGGHNLIATDIVLFTQAAEPMKGFPEAPFSIRVSHVAEQQSVQEELRVIQLVRDSQGEVQSLTVERGQNGTAAVPHPAGAEITLGASGFRGPGDRYGFLEEWAVDSGTQVNASGGISASQTTRNKWRKLPACGR